MKLTCEDLVKYLSVYLNDELDEEMKNAADEHLASCENCSVVLNSTQKTILLYKQCGQAIVMPSSRKNALFDRITADLNLDTSEDT